MFSAVAVCREINRSQPIHLSLPLESKAWSCAVLHDSWSHQSSIRDRKYDDSFRPWPGNIQSFKPLHRILWSYIGLCFTLLSREPVFIANGMLCQPALLCCPVRQCHSVNTDKERVLAAIHSPAPRSRSCSLDPRCSPSEVLLPQL